MPVRPILVVLSAAHVIACGSASSGPGPTPSLASFAGTYATQVTLKQNACGTITVQNNPTTVTHNAGTGAITLSHAGTTYSGTVGADSTFTTTSRAVDVGDGFSYAIAIAGRFRVNAFDADATVDRSGQGTSCRFVVHWAGTR